MEKFTELMTKPELMQLMLEKVKALHHENPLRKDQERLKAKIYGVSSQKESVTDTTAKIIFI